MKFNEMKYERVDYELTSSKMNELLDAMEKAQNKETFLDLFFKLNDVRSHLFTMMILCSIRHSINTADEFYDEETNYWNETSPLFEAIEDRMRKICDEVSFKEELYDEVEDKKVYTLQEEQEGYTIKKEDGIFVVDGPAVDRVMRRVNLEDNESMYYFQKCLDSLGVNQKLKEAGVQEGDTVNICGWELEWYD